MESFFLAETTKYLYLLFDEDNFIHKSDGSIFHPIKHPLENTCTVSASGYIFNTEAHPIDVGSIHCCSIFKIAQFSKDIKTKPSTRGEEKVGPGLADDQSGTFNGSHTCKARSYHKRFSVLGAFFEESTQLKEKP